MKKLLLLLIPLFIIACSENEHKYENDIDGFNELLGPKKTSALNEAVASFHSFLELNFPEQANYNERVAAFLNDFMTKLDHNEEPFYRYNEKEIKSVIESFETSGLRKEIWLYSVNEYYEKKYSILDLFDSTNTDYRPCLNAIEFTTEDVWDTTGLAEMIAIDEAEQQLYPDPYAMNYSREDSINHYLLNPWPEKRFMYLEANQAGAFLYGLAKFASCDTIIRGYVEASLSHGRLGPFMMAYPYLRLEDYSEAFLERLIVVGIYYQLVLINEDKKLILTNKHKPN